MKVHPFTYQGFVEKFGFTPDRFVEYQCLVGDSADNIKGAVGVGPVKATEIIEAGCPTEFDQDKLNKRQRENWPDFLESYVDLKNVFTLEKNLELSCL